MAVKLTFGSKPKPKPKPNVPWKNVVHDVSYDTPEMVDKPIFGGGYEQLMVSGVDIPGSTAALQALIDGFLVSKYQGDFVSWLHTDLYALKLGKYVQPLSISAGSDLLTQVEIKVGDLTVHMHAQVLDHEKKALWKKWGWTWPA